MLKKAFSVFALAALFCLSASAQAVIKFEKTVIDFGTFDEDQPQTCVFEFVNNGDKPLVIHQAFASCGCTVPEHTQEPIQPGKKGVINVRYNGKGKREGEFQKVITVRSNASNSLERVYIRGNMKKK